MTSSQFCTFSVDGLYFGVEVERVQEVLRFQELTRVPLAPAVVSGLINLRGQIVTAVNLRQRLALRERPAGQLPMSVILRSDDGAVSLLVDEIGEVLSVAGEMGEPPPETLRGVGRELCKGVYKLEGRLLLVLDAEKAIQSNGGRFMSNNERKGHEGTP
jgi:purine-binding chemotaxis protein CheW